MIFDNHRTEHKTVLIPKFNLSPEEKKVIYVMKHTKGDNYFMVEPLHEWMKIKVNGRKITVTIPEDNFCPHKVKELIKYVSDNTGNLFDVIVLPDTWNEKFDLCTDEFLKMV